MKIARCRDGDEIYYARVVDDAVERLSGSPFEGAVQPTGRKRALDAVRLLAPVEHTRIFGVGFNYLSHIRETGRENPEIPTLFMKPDSALAGPGDPIVYPREGENVHYETELVVVIGRAGRRVGEAHALDHVLGYTCGNDVSERVIQRKEMKLGCLLAGKGFDTFAPIGPVIATDVDPTALEVIGRLNGEVKQRGNTADLLFPVAMLVAYLSDFTTLRPGDIIMTGTPSGIGPLRPGDRFDIEIPGIGVLSNPVVAESV
jgi:2-keto-4-pentenoate hydratase/2-oxohepta-3-ene-1,7-dioic acid hydratase in catechol pathway